MARPVDQPRSERAARWVRVGRLLLVELVDMSVVVPLVPDAPVFVDDVPLVVELVVSVVVPVPEDVVPEVPELVVPVPLRLLLVPVAVELLGAVSVELLGVVAVELLGVVAVELLLGVVSAAALALIEGDVALVEVLLLVFAPGVEVAGAVAFDGAPPADESPPAAPVWA